MTFQDRGRTYTRPHYLFVKGQQGFSHEHAYPYPVLERGSEGEVDTSFLFAGSEGHGATFDRKVYGYLGERFGKDRLLRRGTQVLESRRRQLRKMGVDPDKPTTLGAMYDAALKREQELERRHRAPNWIRRILGI